MWRINLCSSWTQLSSAQFIFNTSQLIISTALYNIRYLPSRPVPSTASDVSQTTILFRLPLHLIKIKNSNLSLFYSSYLIFFVIFCYYNWIYVLWDYKLQFNQKDELSKKYLFKYKVFQFRISILFRGSPSECYDTRATK